MFLDLEINFPAEWKKKLNKEEVICSDTSRGASAFTKVMSRAGMGPKFSGFTLDWAFELGFNSVNGKKPKEARRASELLTGLNYSYYSSGIQKAGRLPNSCNIK